MIEVSPFGQPNSNQAPEAMYINSYGQDNEDYEAQELDWEDEEVKNYCMTDDEEYHADMASGKFKTMPVLEPYDQGVEIKYLKLLHTMRKEGMVDLREISGMKHEQGFPTYLLDERKFIVMATSEEVAEEALERLGDFIEKLRIQKVMSNLLPYKQVMVEDFFNHRLQAEKMVLFTWTEKQETNLYIGGLAKIASLQIEALKIKAINFRSVRLLHFRNTRTYRCLMNQLLTMPGFIEPLQTKAAISYVKVAKGQVARAIDSKGGLVILLGSPFYAYEQTCNINKTIRSMVLRYTTLVLCLRPGTMELPELACDKVRFTYLQETRFPQKFMSYIVIQALTKDFINNHALIIEQLSKINKCNKHELGSIIGVRFIKEFRPRWIDFGFDRNTCYMYKFPKERAYSVTVRTIPEKGAYFQWKQLIIGIATPKKVVTIQGSSQDDLVDSQKGEEVSSCNLQSCAPECQSEEEQKGE